MALQRWLSLGSADLDARIGEVAEELGMSARVLHQPTHQLSGGEAARAMLAALLLSRFDLATGDPQVFESPTCSPPLGKTFRTRWRPTPILRDAGR